MKLCHDQGIHFPPTKCQKNNDTITKCLLSQNMAIFHFHSEIHLEAVKVGIVNILLTLTM